MCVRVCSLELNKRLSDARPTLLAAHRTACEFTVQSCGTRSGVVADSCLILAIGPLVWRSVAHVRSMVPDGALLGLRHDEIGQAMLLNLLLRNYLEYDSHHPELAHCTALH